MVKSEIKDKVVHVTISSYNKGMFAGTSGNLSIYDPETKYIYITPSSQPYETMTSDDIMVIDTEGNIIEGKHKPSSEWRMHAQIYKHMSSTVTAVVHTHSPYATAFAVSKEKIPVILIEMVPFIGGDVPLAEFALPGTNEVGLNAIDALKDRKACLMTNHGVLAVGKTIEQAQTCAVYVEDAAKICAISKACNNKICVIDESNIQMMRNRMKK